MNNLEAVIFQSLSDVPRHVVIVEFPVCAKAGSETILASARADVDSRQGVELSENEEVDAPVLNTSGSTDVLWEPKKPVERWWRGGKARQETGSEGEIGECQKIRHSGKSIQNIFEAVVDPDFGKNELQDDPGKELCQRDRLGRVCHENRAYSGAEIRS